MSWREESVQSGDDYKVFHVLEWGTWKFRVFEKDGSTEVRLSKHSSPSGLRIYEKILSHTEDKSIDETKKEVDKILSDL